MKKIILSKKKFLKISLTNLNLNNLCNLTKMHKLSLRYIPIIVMKNALINLFEDDSNSGAVTATIIGKMKYEHAKISPKNNFQKRTSKVDNAKPSKVTTKNKKKAEIQQAGLEASNRVSEQKNLMGKVITITPYMSKKKKLIIGASMKKEQDKKQAIPVRPKENTAKIINPIIKKQNDTKQSKPKKVGSNISRNTKPKEITSQNSAIKIGNNNITKTNQSKTPKYKLQKKSSPNLVALFSVTAASLLLAFTFGHKKLFSSILVASSLAIAGFGIFSSKSTKKDKQLVKKIAN